MPPPDLFTSLRGSWTVTRKILSRTQATTPGGHFTGTAEFRPREPTFKPGPLVQQPPASVYHSRDVLPLQENAQGDKERPLLQENPLDQPGYSAAAKENEFLYIENGIFASDTWSAPARRMYIYQRKPEGWTAWFVKPAAEEEVDYFFHEVDMGEIREAGEGWKTATKHLCGDDVYETSYRVMEWDAYIGLERFAVRYTVKGPKKDYVAEAIYAR